MLKIQTTGLEQYAPGGQAVLKIMFIGGPGAGKTRLSSYWPKPIYANCEAGLASIADRKMPFVDIKTSQDMLDFLTHLKLECRRPYEERQFQTVVIDTLDAFQRKTKDEWLQANPGAQSFRGFDAWGYLDTKMQMLLTRLLNLDMNVIVNVHYKDKTIREGSGENATERQELMLQLSGDVKDSVFNDFDLVGWLGKYYEAVDGQRVEKRGLTFKSTPEKPFLKDRLFVTPPWLEVQFSDQDYKTLFAAFVSRLDQLEVGEEIGEIASAGPEASRPTAGVVGPHSGGPLPPVDPKDIPLAQYDKPTLQKMVRDLARERPDLAASLEFKQNTIKAELVEMLEQAQKVPAPAVVDAGVESAVAVAELTESAGEPRATTTSAEVAVFGDPPTDQTQQQVTDDTPAVLLSAPATPVSLSAVDTEVGSVDPATGEMTAMTVEDVASSLGGDVLSESTAVEVVPTPAPEPPPPALVPPAPSSAGRPGVCQREGCQQELASQNQDYVKLSQIKYRGYLCNDDYQGAKNGTWTPPRPGSWPHELASQALQTTE